MAAALLIPFFIALVSAVLETTHANGTCRTLSAYGQEQTCLYTNTFRPAEKAILFGALCGLAPYFNNSDTGLSSICHANEAHVYVPIVGNKFASSGEKCDSAPGQYWQYYNYTWGCCLCPPGWISGNTNPLYCGLYEGCMRCSEKDEQLVVKRLDTFTTIECITTSTTSTTTTTTTTSTTSTSSCATSVTSLRSAHPPQASNAICKSSEFANCPKAHKVQKKNSKGKTITQFVCNKDPTGKTLAGCPSKCFLKTPPACPQKFPKRCCWPDQDGINFIRGAEGFCTTFYNQGDNRKTIGWGHNCNITQSLCNSLTLPIDTCIGENLFAADIQRLLHEAFRPLPNAKLLTQGQLNALLDLVYQCGNSAIAKGTPIWKDLEAKRADLVCGHITAKGTGSANCQSYKSRRLAEQEKCKGGSKVALGCSFAHA
ncbi:hypothetical protein AOL_s00081g181 [Orbilia oligospora ATCC 24927]|uniref:Lysozyme n=1 Tax=Arthrobotrys oligospora (strain ATCC 24927 / CBS 115.81 / DSM 1491) TaxID=756982 RepID=G1XFN9_ARTOA|nr:hypothetical protein AOL_s00081g181 [Orbilia oligospora ATCC 24927]EGX48077.1 hypothetical protein AOL_s00081g181 [Orbilia oligospora ATCC 24927]